MIPKTGKTGSITARTTSIIIFVFIMLILVFSIETPIAFCQTPGEDKETEAEWYDGFIFQDASFATRLTRALSWTYVQSADIGEVIKTARRIKDGDIYSWYDEWYKEANRILGLAEKWEKEGHATSASEAYFRATTYFQSAGFYMVAPKDRDRARDCRKRSRATFLKAIEAYPNISYVEVPYGDVVIPGYLAKSEKGAGFLHMAILVDFDGKVEQLRSKGFTVHVEESVDPFPGCTLLREAYVLPKDASRGVLIDLMDAENFPVSLGGLAPE